MMPFLPRLRQVVAARKANKEIAVSQAAVLEVMEFLAIVGFQGCLDLVYTGRALDKDGSCPNPVIRRMMAHPDFQERLHSYDLCHQHQLFNRLQPRSTDEMLWSLITALSQSMSAPLQAVHASATSVLPPTISYDEMVARAKKTVAAGQSQNPAKAQSDASADLLAEEDVADLSPLEEDGDAEGLNADMVALLSPLRAAAGGGSTLAAGGNSAAVAAAPGSPIVLANSDAEPMLEAARAPSLPPDLGAGPSTTAARELNFIIAEAAQPRPLAMAQPSAAAGHGSESEELLRLRAELEAQKAEVAMLRAQQAAAPPLPQSSSLMAALAGIVDERSLQVLPQQLAGVPQHLHGQYALEFLTRTGALNLNRPYAGVNSRNLGPGLLHSPPKHTVHPLPLSAQYLLPTSLGPYNLAGNVAMELPVGIGGVMQPSLLGPQAPFVPNTSYLQQLNAFQGQQSVQLAAGAPPVTFVPAIAVPGTAADLEEEEGEQPPAKKRRTGSRYKPLSADGAALPMWKSFGSDVAALIKWLYVPRFGSPPRSVVELELEAGEGKVDRSWRSKKGLDQRAGELKAFWQEVKAVAREASLRLGGSAAAIGEKEMIEAAKEVQKRKMEPSSTRLPTVPALMRGYNRRFGGGKAVDQPEAPVEGGAADDEGGDV